MSEIKSCEQYVLSELMKAQAEVEDTKNALEMSMERERFLEEALVRYEKAFSEIKSRIASASEEMIFIGCLYKVDHPFAFEILKDWKEEPDGSNTN